MNVLFAIVLLFTNWYYIPKDSPAVPVEIESIDLKLKKDELAITFFSLSDGEVSLIHHGNGENILINTGGNRTTAELEQLLQLYGVEQISTIILTGENLNSWGNLSWLIKNYNVNQLIAGAAAASMVKGKISEIGDVALHIWKENTKQQILPGLEADVLYEGNQEGEGMDVSFTFLRHKILFMSSISSNAEEAFMKRELSDINIVKFPGFGRNELITEQLIKHLDPQIAVLFHKKNVKPSSDLFQLLNDAWIDVYYTKKHGTITVKFTKVNYEVMTIMQEE